MKQKKVNHALHIVLTVVTAGFSLPVYLCIIVMHSIRNKAGE